MDSISEVYSNEVNLLLSLFYVTYQQLPCVVNGVVKAGIIRCHALQHGVRSKPRIDRFVCGNSSNRELHGCIADQHTLSCRFQLNKHWNTEEHDSHSKDELDIVVKGVVSNIYFGGKAKHLPLLRLRECSCRVPIIKWLHRRGEQVSYWYARLSKKRPNSANWCVVEGIR